MKTDAQKAANARWYANNPDYNNKASKAWHAKNPGRRVGFNRKCLYGVTKEQYAMLLKQQKNRCAVCKNKEVRTRNGKVIELSVDHNHETGAIRGLLCSRCNTAAGLLYESATVVATLAKYLRRKRCVLFVKRS